MLLFLLMLVPLLGVVGLSLSGSLLLDAKTRFDQAALSSAVAASSDACMASPYAFDLYECTSGGVRGQYAANCIDPPPQPPLPTGFVCGNTVINHEQQIAYNSAKYTVSTILTKDYPGYGAPVECTNPLNSACEAMATSNTIVYRIKVSPWYLYDISDEDGSGQSDDTWDVFSANPNAGQLRSDPDDLPQDTQQVCASAPRPALPGAGNFGRRVQVDLWTRIPIPLATFLGALANVPVTTTFVTYGCSG